VYIYLFPCVIGLLIEFSLGWKMSTESSVYVGFANGASRHTWNLASVALVVYSPEGQLVSPGGICLGPSMNNVVEYSTAIEIFRDVVSHGIRYL
jgi:hypothetical protein